MHELHHVSPSYSAKADFASCGKDRSLTCSKHQGIRPCELALLNEAAQVFTHNDQYAVAAVL